MSQQFSAAIKLGDLDDYLSPANECIVVTTTPDKPKSSVIKPVSSKQEKSSSVAGIALSDCLACSGCVTSAETVLLESQSSAELLKTVADESSKHTHFFVSISSASRRALSENLKISPSQICAHVQSVLAPTIPNVTIIDTSLSEAISVLETVQTSNDRLTLTSHCPGWTCYATKVLGDEILPHLSRVQSPEQIQGLILKYLVPKMNRLVRGSSCDLSQIAPYRKIFHILVSPCFDKKLEILRPHYDGVQMVLSTTELIDLIGNKPNTNIHSQTATAPYFQAVCSLLGLCDSWAVSGEEDAVTGGGYARATTSSSSPSWVAELQKKRPNMDLLRFGNDLIRSHGFRNIQNITRRIREGKLDQGFVEIMACPGGCPKGGGQPTQSLESDEKSWIHKLSDGLFRPRIVDHLALDHVGSPSEFIEAMRMRNFLISVVGRSEWQSLITTEWKPIESIGSVKW